MSEKRKKPWNAATKKMIKRINETSLSKEEMFKFAEEAGLLDPEERDFEGHVITAARVFEGDADKILSVMFRMRALARLVTEGIPGWTKPEQPDGAVMTHGALFVAAGVEPLTESGGEVAFDREKMLRRVFQLAKDLI